MKIKVAVVSFNVVQQDPPGTLKVKTPKRGMIGTGHVHIFTLDILVLPSPVRKPRLLISFWITKFCSSRLKFYTRTQNKNFSQTSDLLTQQLLSQTEP